MGHWIVSSKTQVVEDGNLAFVSWVFLFLTAETHM